MNMLHINYQISTTFFDGHIEIEQESDQVIDFQEAEKTLEEYENDYIFYDTPELWNEDHIFSVRIFMIVDGKRHFDRTINIVQLKYLAQWDELEIEKQETDEFTQRRLSIIQKDLENQFQQASTLTLEEFLTHKTHYLGDTHE